MCLNNVMKTKLFLVIIFLLVNSPSILAKKNASTKQVTDTASISDGSCPEDECDLEGDSEGPPPCPYKDPLKEDKQIGGILFPKGTILTCSPEISAKASLFTIELPKNITFLGEKFDDLYTLDILLLSSDDVIRFYDLYLTSAFSSGRPVAKGKIFGRTWLFGSSVRERQLGVTIYHNENSIAPRSGTLAEDQIIDGILWKGGTNTAISFYPNGELKSGINKNLVKYEGGECKPGSLVLMQNKKPVGCLCHSSYDEKEFEGLLKLNKCSLTQDFTFEGFNYHKGDRAVFDTDGDPIKVHTKSETNYSTYNEKLSKSINPFYSGLSTTWPSETVIHNFLGNDGMSSPGQYVTIHKKAHVLNLDFPEDTNFFFKNGRLARIDLKKDVNWSGYKIYGGTLDVLPDGHSFYAHIKSDKEYYLTAKIEERNSNECTPGKRILFIDGKMKFCCPNDPDKCLGEEIKNGIEFYIKK